MSASHPIPRVGDTVVLNDHGLRQLFGSSSGLSHMKTLRMRVTAVDPVSLTHPEPTHAIEVDNEDITQFLIDHLCFDIVEQAGSRMSDRSAPNVRYEPWGHPEGRSGIQRTLDSTNQEDLDFLTYGIAIVDEHGVRRQLTLEEAERMGIRRVVASRDIHTGELKWRE